MREIAGRCGDDGEEGPSTGGIRVTEPKALIPVSFVEVIVRKTPEAFEIILLKRVYNPDSGREELWAVGRLDCPLDIFPRLLFREARRWVCNWCSHLFGAETRAIH